MNRTKLFSRPHVEVYENFLTEEECDSVLKLLNDHQEYYAKSLGFDHRINASAQTEYRTSSSVADTPNYLYWLKEKIQKEILSEHLPHLTVECFESLQSQKYEVGEYYRTHLDYFNVYGYPDVTKNDRVATVIIYLNDDFKGGTTKFQRLGFEVQPKKGTAAFFDYSMENIYVKEKTYHSGEPVTEGKKYIITAWIRANPILSEEDIWPIKKTDTK